MLLGFESIKSTLLDSYQNQKLHHAILLCGKKGIGKASFAREFAEKILGEKIANHPDLLLIEKESGKKEITVDKIRKISEFANQTSAISPYKFIIVDSACELNKSAANALLKILEEPRDNNFLILVAHNLSRVLATIRSRCQIVKIADLNSADFTQILRQKKFSAEEISFLSEICDNAPAIAIEMGTELTQLYQLFLESLKNKKINPEFLKKISDKNFSFVIFEKIFEFFSNRLFKFNVGAKINFFYNEEEIFLRTCLESFASDRELFCASSEKEFLSEGATLAQKFSEADCAKEPRDEVKADSLLSGDSKQVLRLNQKFRTKKIFTRIEESLILLRKTTSLNLDKKLCLTNIFNRISYD